MTPSGEIAGWLQNLQHLNGVVWLLAIAATASGTRMGMSFMISSGTCEIFSEVGLGLRTCEGILVMSELAWNLLDFISSVGEQTQPER